MASPQATAAQREQTTFGSAEPEHDAGVEPAPEELAEIVLAYHDGDHLAAIKALLEDTAHLRQQLALTTLAMRKGFTRGWLPESERVD